MWNDFVEAFGFRFEKKEKFPKASLFVSELKTWVEWHEKAAEHRMHLTAFGAFCGGVGLGGLFALIVVLVQIGGR